MNQSGRPLHISDEDKDLMCLLKEQYGFTAKQISEKWDDTLKVSTMTAWRITRYTRKGDIE